MPRSSVAGELTTETVVYDGGRQVTAYVPAAVGRSTGELAFDPHRFAAHEAFFVEDIRRWAATRLSARLPAGRTALSTAATDGGSAAAGPSLVRSIGTVTHAAGEGPRLHGLR
jgi:hypothetical protein